MTAQEAQKDAMIYLYAHPCIQRLKQAFREGVLRTNEFYDLRAQALRGDVEGANKELRRLLMERL